MIIEVIIILAIVALLAAVFVLYRRQNAPAKPAEAPQSYYADVNQLAGAPAGGQPGFGGAAAGAPDPLAGFGSPAAAPVAAPAPAPAPAPVAAPAAPPAGTPAGWLPDPSGVADTLRYWDGNAWTQHVAQRN
jgi:hypothetical protein